MWTFSIVHKRGFFRYSASQKNLDLHKTYNKNFAVEEFKRSAWELKANVNYVFHNIDAFDELQSNFSIFDSLNVTDKDFTNLVQWRLFEG